jgi:hypothetical protein
MVKKTNLCADYAKIFPLSPSKNIEIVSISVITTSNNGKRFQNMKLQQLRTA